jgi:hypothetical protein
MLNQSSNEFNTVLTYLDCGGNNVWWSTNSTSKSKAIVELLITGNGVDAECIETECNPICSLLVESEQEQLEELTSNQKLIYPTFIKENNKLTVLLNNLELIEQPNYIEESCVESDCIEEFGVWTKALIQSNKEVLIDGETYYFIKANIDHYNYAYLYNITLIHEETGEEILISKNKGLISNKVELDIKVPTGFNPVITITKFNSLEVITTYKFIDKPLYLRSNWNTNLTWQPLYNNTEEVLLSIIYLLNTDLEVENNKQLVLYKEDKQQTLISILLNTIDSITTDNSLSYSYIKNKTSPIDYNTLISTNRDNIEDIILNPAVYSTTTYTKNEESNLISILILLVASLIKNNTLLLIYIDICVDINSTNLKDEVLKVIAFTEAYKITKDVYHLSIATSIISQIEKRYKTDDGTYIESLENPITTIQSQVYSDVLNFYVNGVQPNMSTYITEQITYVDNLQEVLYLTNSADVITSNPIYLITLRLVGLDLPSVPISSIFIPSSLIEVIPVPPIVIEAIPISSETIEEIPYELIENLAVNDLRLVNNILKLNNRTVLNGDILNSLSLYKLDVFLNFKNTIPTDFGWLSDDTPIQDLIVESITKPIIDLYLHSKYIEDKLLLKDALTTNYTDIIINKKELLLNTITTDTTNIRSSLWPGRYSNSIDLEIEGYYDDITLEKINNIKSLGIETNLLSSIDLPLINNFTLCIDIVKETDITNELAILLQETTDPITQESSLEDYLLINQIL